MVYVFKQLHLIDNNNDNNEREDLVSHLVLSVNVIFVTTLELKFSIKQVDKGQISTMKR